MKKLSFVFVCLIFFFGLLLATNQAIAGTCTCTFPGPVPDSGAFVVNDSCSSCSEVVCVGGRSCVFSSTPTTPTPKPDVSGQATGEPRTGASTQLEDPLGKRGFEKITNDAISFLLGLTGVLALVSFIYGGILWMLSRGDMAFIKKGKDMMIWSVWGIVIIFAAYAILKVVFQALGLK